VDRLVNQSQHKLLQSVLATLTEIVTKQTFADPSMKPNVSASEEINAVILVGNPSILKGLKKIIDDLDKVIQQGQGNRKAAAIEADKLLDDEIHRYQTIERSKQAVPVIAALREQSESIRDEVNVQALRRLARGESANDELRLINDAINERISKLADNKRVFHLDISDKFLEDDGTLPKSIMPDLLHPNPKGYEIWAKAMEPTLAKLLGEK